MTEDEMVGWHHGLDGHEFEQGLGNSGRTEYPVMLSSRKSQRVRHGLGTKQVCTEKCFEISM